MNLQFREEALKEGKSGARAIVPGKPDESEMIARLTTDDASERMPKKQPPLGAEEIATLRKWITEGAPWENHWAYTPPKNSGRTIDAIVSERLAVDGLLLSAETDRATLARRTALDLTGLPPEPDEVRQFVADGAPDAYGRWIDRLLASPAYGERWAVPWLDLARYADSKGYEKDSFRDMWRYRDWVIEALNSDKPYDQFLTEQLAGDLLPGATPEQVIATAFHRNTLANDEDGTDDEEFRTYAVIDRINTTFEALQGTSIGCVQCHGHPYDPFVHREYYELMAFFNNTADADRKDDSPTREFHSREDVEKATAMEAKMAAARRQLDEELARPENRSGIEKWLNEVRPKGGSSALTAVSAQATAGKYAADPDGRIHLLGDSPARTTITVEGGAPVGKLEAFALEALPDDSLPGHGPGGSGNGNFILTMIRVSAISPDGKVETPLKIAQARATYEQAGWPVAEAIKIGLSANNEGEGGWAINGGTGARQTATFVFAQPADLAAGAKLRIVIECENERWEKHILASFRFSTARGGSSGKLAELPGPIRDLLARDAASWKPEERQKIERQYFAGVSPKLDALYRTIDETRGLVAAMPQCKLPIMQELTGAAARTTKIFHRGNWMDKTDPVQPATPKILNAWHEEYPRNRLGFAEWMTNGENPLTARVQVNRVWEQLFGIGLVETLEDFGSQGDMPIYRELLDSLAVRFQSEFKWSQKRLVREIVMSRVYRQSSKASKALLERDPANRLLARGPRFRLTSEELRDQALAAGGLLSRKMFGPPVMPYQPPGSWLVPYEGRDWVTSPGEDSHRRSVYTFIRRSATYPSMITFDGPSRENCTVRRMRTNTPLQALDGLNSPVFMEAAAGLAKRMAAEGGSDLDGQLARGFLIASGRSASADEIAILKKLSDRVEGNLTLVANAILNVDEVLNKN